MENMFEIDTDLLRQTISTMRENLESMNNQFTKLFEDVGSLNGMWQGPANDAFRAQFGKDTEYYQTYYKTLSDYISCLEYAAREYDNCEDKVLQAVNAVKIEGR